MTALHGWVDLWNLNRKTKERNREIERLNSISQLDLQIWVRRTHERPLMSSDLQITCPLSSCQINLALCTISAKISKTSTLLPLFLKHKPHKLITYARLWICFSLFWDPLSGFLMCVKPGSFLGWVVYGSTRAQNMLPCLKCVMGLIFKKVKLYTLSLVACWLL